MVWMLRAVVWFLRQRQRTKWRQHPSATVHVKRTGCVPFSCALRRGRFKNTYFSLGSFQLDWAATRAGGTGQVCAERLRSTAAAVEEAWAAKVQRVEAAWRDNLEQCRQEATATAEHLQVIRRSLSITKNDRNCEE
eukprot:1180353-Prorocentrum_minimum.AAC.1